jgi:hypothetical protein
MDPIERDTGIDDRDTAVKRGMAMAYVWGRQDGGESDRDTGYSQAFASVYALANRLTGGYVGPLQAAHHEWSETGRVLIKMPGGDGKIVAVQVPDGAPDTVRAAAYPADLPDGSFLPHWPGKVNKPAAVSTG